jgi:hypothetical protein
VAASSSLYLGGIPLVGNPITGVHLYDVDHCLLINGTRRSLEQFYGVS